jgi:hypothetical protein
LQIINRHSLGSRSLGSLCSLDSRDSRDSLDSLDHTTRRRPQVWHFLGLLDRKHEMTQA